MSPGGSAEKIVRQKKGRKENDDWRVAKTNQSGGRARPMSEEKKTFRKRNAKGVGGISGGEKEKRSFFRGLQQKGTGGEVTTERKISR